MYMYKNTCKPNQPERAQGFHTGPIEQPHGASSTHLTTRLPDSNRCYLYLGWLFWFCLRVETPTPNSIDMIQPVSHFHYFKQNKCWLWFPFLTMSHWRQCSGGKPLWLVVERTRTHRHVVGCQHCQCPYKLVSRRKLHKQWVSVAQVVFIIVCSIVISCWPSVSSASFLNRLIGANGQIDKSDCKVLLNTFDTNCELMFSKDKHMITVSELIFPYSKSAGTPDVNAMHSSALLDHVASHAASIKRCKH